MPTQPLVQYNAATLDWLKTHCNSLWHYGKSATNIITTTGTCRKTLCQRGSHRHHMRQAASCLSRQLCLWVGWCESNQHAATACCVVQEEQPGSFGSSTAVTRSFPSHSCCNLEQQHLLLPMLSLLKTGSCQVANDIMCISNRPTTCRVPHMLQQ